MTLPQDRDQAPSRAKFLSRAWNWIAKPASSVVEVGARRRAQLTMGLALVITFTNFAGLLALLGVPDSRLSFLVAVVLLVVCFTAYLLGRTKYFYAGSLILPVALSISAYASIFAGSEDISGALVTSIPVALVIASGLLPFGALIAVVVSNVVLTGLLPVFIADLSMAEAGQNAGIFLSLGFLLAVITAFRNNLERVRLQALQETNWQLTDVRASLEERVNERTVDLERRSAYLTAAADVARAASSILDADQLIREVVDLIRSRFGLYYVGLFRVDDSNEWAVLRAGTGEAGQAMLARGHRIAVGEGMIGWSVANAQARVASQAEADAVRLNTRELPDTRSEAAIPLRTRGRVIGALTVQSTRANAFDMDAMTALQTMADQVAVALENARLFAESEAALERARQAYGELSSQAWSRMLASGEDVGYRFERQAVSRIVGGWQPEMLQAMHSSQTVVDASGDEAVLSIPLKVRDQVVGVVDVRKPVRDGAWTDTENELVEALAEQLGLALESARLYEDTRQRAARERLIGDVSGRIRETLDMETMLRTATSEIRQALGLEDLIVRLALPKQNGG